MRARDCDVTDGDTQPSAADPGAGSTVTNAGSTRTRSECALNANTRQRHSQPAGAGNSDGESNKLLGS